MPDFPVLIKPDGSCVSVKSAPGEALLSGMYTASYEVPKETLAELMALCIEKLPASVVVLSSGSLIDQYMVNLLSQTRTVHVIQIQTGSVEMDRLIAWVAENRLKYFLTDANFAAVAFTAIELLKQHATVALVGPVPQLHDLAWSFSQEIPLGRKLFHHSQWAIYENAKSGTLARLCAHTKGLHSLLDARALLAFVRESEILAEGGKKMALTGIKFVGGNSIARYLNYGQQFEERAPLLPLSPLQVKELGPYLLQRSSKANRCFNRVERYVN